MTLTIEQLENALHQPGPVGSPDLHAVRRAGTRRRRTRRVLVATAGAAAVAVVGGVGANVVGGEHAVPPANLPLAEVSGHPVDPSTLSSLARTALHDVAGATQVSDHVVLIPSNGVAPDGTDRGLLVDHPVELPARGIVGVTGYPRDAMPGWLYDEIHSREESAAYPDGSYSVGGLVDGVGVDQGQLSLACATMPEWDEHGCGVSLVLRTSDGWSRVGGLGTDRFLDAGHHMETFTIPQYVDGQPATLWIGGLDGTDVRTVDFVLADSTRVPAELSSGTISPGDTLFWAVVTGRPTDVVARDADGNVIEDHQVKSCSDPVDCEVR